MSGWPFEDTPNTAAITTRQVLEGSPILQVTHDEDDGSWQFLCGTTNDPADARVVAWGGCMPGIRLWVNWRTCRKAG